MPTKRRGLLIVLEGIDGSGKTTQARALIRRLRRRGIKASLFREPTRGRWGREIKRMAARADSLTPEEELALFVKDRRENVARNLGPALRAGRADVLDRYYFSTMAYQGAKGLDVGRIRKMNEAFAIAPDLVIVTVERVLPWRERGWVTADTHVHFLSPSSALLEGAGEGVNVVNLLASQRGELMTNVGDFDGRTTTGSRESGGDGEYLVRVGTENRQHVLGHISLIGYGGAIIAPMTTGGPDESALGDPVEILLTEWARQCRKQGGIVVVPHFPHPRAEHAASIVLGEVAGI